MISLKTGQMLDESGNPVAKAVVKFADKTRTVDERNYWKISELPTAIYTIIISRLERRIKKRLY